jgi:2-polyprenyl-3-methyl-5-hydroxy-6-metoxy-1,4-benzoquinol methylase
MDIKEQELLGGAVDSHWYYRSKQLALDSLLSGMPVRHVLDIGAGSAIFSKHLLDGGAESALCVDHAYRSERSETYNGKPIRFAREIASGDADLVLLMDVLEHVDDDGALIRASIAGAAPGAHVLISVPAFQCLFSAHDRFLEHRRRYTAGSLEAMVAGAGLEPIVTRYFFATILPIVAAMRLLQRDGPPKSSLAVHPKLVNAALVLAHRAELPFFRFNRIGGLSVFCLARAP